MILRSRDDGHTTPEYALPPVNTALQDLRNWIDLNNFTLAEAVEQVRVELDDMALDSIVWTLSPDEIDHAERVLDRIEGVLL